MQCNNRGNVSARDKHEQMCKLQSFMSLGCKCLTQNYSCSKFVLSQLVLETSALLSCIASRQSHCLVAESMTG